MTKDEFEVYPFEEDKCYIILVDPGRINLETLAKAPWEKDIVGLFLPCRGGKLSDAMKSISFESIQCAKDWLNELEKQNATN